MLKCNLVRHSRVTMVKTVEHLEAGLVLATTRAPSRLAYKPGLQLVHSRVHANRQSRTCGDTCTRDVQVWTFAPYARGCSFTSIGNALAYKPPGKVVFMHISLSCI